MNDFVTLTRLFDTGVLAIIAAAFLVMVWKMFGGWQKKEGQIFDMAKDFSAALEKSSAVIEANSRVLEGNQQVLEQVLANNGKLAETQAQLLTELKNVQTLNNKIYTELRVLRERGGADG